MGLVGVGRVEVQVQTRLRDKFQPRKARANPVRVSYLTERSTCPEPQPLQHHRCSRSNTFGAGCHASITALSPRSCRNLHLHIRFFGLPRATRPSPTAVLLITSVFQFPEQHQLGVFRAAELSIFSPITWANSQACQHERVTFEVQFGPVGCGELGSQTMGRHERGRHGCRAVGLGRGGDGRRVSANCDGSKLD
jgi:hypothetical protein